MKVRYLTSAWAVAALVGCAGAPQAVEPQAGAVPASDRQVLAAGLELGLEEAIAQLPERIPVSEAEGLLVRISEDQVEATGPRYGVLKHDDDDEDDDREQRRRRVVTRGFSPYFGGGFGSYSYYPFGNYYFPYVRSGGYFYPYRTAREALYGDPLVSGGPFYNFGSSSYYPFLYGYGGGYTPYYWNWWAR